jgi:hypothetical protein
MRFSLIVILQETGLARLQAGQILPSGVLLVLVQPA